GVALVAGLAVAGHAQEHCTRPRLVAKQVSSGESGGVPRGYSSALTGGVAAEAGRLAVGSWTTRTMNIVSRIQRAATSMVMRVTCSGAGGRRGWTPPSRRKAPAGRRPLRGGRRIRRTRKRRTKRTTGSGKGASHEGKFPAAGAAPVPAPPPGDRVGNLQGLNR